MDCKVISVDNVATNSDNVTSSHKKCSSTIENRLRLKRTNKESANSQCKLPEGTPELNKIHSIQDRNEATEEHKKEDILNNTLHSNENDSILDFRSPEAKKVRPSVVKAKLSKFTSDTTKRKKATGSKVNIVINNHQEVKIKPDTRSKKRSRETQPSIESSFFKSKNDAEYKDISTGIKTAFVCPLCFKACKDTDSQTLHMKNCAVKNNVSTKKLLDAIELQKRQASERQSLGLLAAPVVQDKKKSAPRKPNTHEESDLQLALALSKSLQEAEELNDYNETEGLLGTSDSFLHETAEPVYKGQLETFGFANNKAIIVSKTRKRKLNEVTVLQTRSNEERNRILTEKIAEILIGNEAITQSFQESIQCNGVIKQKIELKSCFLHNILRTDEKLWDKTRLTTGQNHFYVSELATHIPPCGEKLQACEENVSMLENIDVSKVSEMEQKQNVNVKETPNVKLEDCVDAEVDNYADEQFRETLVSDWANTLNDSSASDLIIFVRDGKHIWAHKLVIYVRCATMLLDITPNDHEAFARIKEKISLTDISYHVALAFLEFIYCGAMKKYLHVFEDAAVFSQLRILARKYKVKELFAYLRKREATMQQLKVEPDIKETIPIAENISPKLNKNTPDISYLETRNEFPTAETGKFKVKNSQEYEGRFLPISESVLQFSDLHLTQYNEQLKDISGETKQDAHTENSLKTNVNCTNDICILRARSTSPDLFDDTDDVINDVESNARKTPDTNKLEKGTNFSIPESVNWESEFNIGSQGGSPEHIDITSSPEYSTNASTVNTRCDEEVSEVATEDCTSDTLDMLLNQTSANSAMGMPPSRKLRRKSMSFSGITKQKSNLSLFIERVQKENAKSDLDTDSELDSTLQVPSKLSRNPFNINRHDESDTSHKSRANAIMPKKGGKKNVLDIFDECIEDTGLNQSATHEENEEGIRDRSYEAVHSGSLANLMGTLDNSKKNSTRLVEETLGNIEQNLKKSHILSRLANETTLVSETDTDECEMSMYSRYKRKHRNNSIDKYRTIAKKYISNNLTLDKSEENEESEAETIPVNSPCSGTEDVTVLSDIDVDSLDESTSPKTHNNQAENYKVISNVSRSENISSHNSMDSLNTECLNDVGDIHDAERSIRTDSPHSRDTEILIDDKETRSITPKITTPMNRQNDLSKTLSGSQVNKLMHSKSNISINAEGKRTKASSVTPTFREIDTHQLLESPVLVTSSPELNTDNLDMTPKKEKRIGNLDKKNDKDDFDDIFENEIFLENVRFDNHENSASSSILGTLNSLEKRSTNAINSNDKCVSQSQRERIKSSDNANKSIRKFGRKSMSEGNFSLKTVTNNTVKFGNTFNPSQCKCGRKKANKGPLKLEIIRDNVTPPPNYDTIKTPELHEELKRYGLKQQKRGRAVKLLTYIYNELHPTVSSTTETLELEPMVLSSEDESPPRKKLSQRSIKTASEVGVADDDCELPMSQLSTNEHSPVNIIAEEMQFDEPESVGITNNASSIKNMFLRLLKTNEELYNKILMYEPLSIEYLHATIKSSGFKCKMNDLMDFLDEQCITFYVQENSGKSRTRKK